MGMRRSVGISLLIFLVVGVTLSFVLAHRTQSAETSKVPGIATLPTEEGINGTSTRSSVAGFREYRNERYHFSLLFPENLHVSFFEDGAGSGTVTFENTDDPEDVVGFEIFVVPYNGNVIPEERFSLDEPSGIVKDRKNITVDGASGIGFYGLDERLLDTREVWFTHEGLLYEVTTFKVLDKWLEPI